VRNLIRIVLLTCVAFVTAEPAARADVVAEWNVAALDAIRAERTPPPVASRALAILHVSSQGCWRPITASPAILEHD